MDGERVSHRLGALQKLLPANVRHDHDAHEGNPPRGKSTVVPAAPRESPLRVGQRKTGGKKNQRSNVSRQQLHTKLINGVPAVGDPQGAAFKKSSPILPNIKLSAVFQNASAVLFFPRSIWALRGIKAARGNGSGIMDALARGKEKLVAPGPSPFQFK